MAETPQVPIEEQIACVQREIVMRERAYPRWVEGGRMTANKARGEIAAMQAVLATLEEVAAKSDLFAPKPPKTGSVPIFMDGREVGRIDKEEAAWIFDPSGATISYSIGYSVNEGVREVTVVREPSRRSGDA